MLPWALCALLSLLALLLLMKVRLLHRAMDTLVEDLGEILSTDTNVLLSLSTRDRHARRLASGLNRHLRLLRTQRRRYLSGDRELKEAVTNLSHDLRTPLTAVCGYVDLLEQEDLSPAARQYLSLIKGRTEAMKRLTEELFRCSLSLSTQALTLEPVDLRALVEEAAAGFYAALTARGIQPVIRLPDAPVMRQLDRTAAGRLLGNILGNAVKYSAGDLELLLTPEGELRCANTAPELDEVTVGQLFDRFFTVEAARGSTGLGLSIAKALAERMGASIRAEYSGGRLCVLLQF